MTENKTETWEERRARETAEAVAKTRELFQYAERIIHELGSDVWELMPGNDAANQVAFENRRPHIRRKSDGANFDLGPAYRERDRIAVSPNWPKDATGSVRFPHFGKYSDLGEESPGITF